MSFIDSYLTGLIHTLSGLDHLIAMISVGLISSQLGRQATWGVPIFFVIFLIIGGAIGLTMEESVAKEATGDRAEQVIYFSDMLLPLAILWIPVAANRLWWGTMAGISALLIAIFGYYHGFAHGGEIPTGAIAAGYVTGFATTSVLMHILGVAIGEGARVFPQPRVTRGVIAALMLGLTIPFQVRFWGEAIPSWLGKDYLIYVFG